MAKKKTMYLEPFGDLVPVAGDLWKCSLPFAIFGKDWLAPLMVNVDVEDGIEENQAAAFRLFQAHPHRHSAEAEKAIFKYYQSVCNGYRSRHGISDPDDKNIPIVKSSEEMRKLVELEGLFFPYVRPVPTFGILCQCSWEVERGLAVKFERGMIVDVGFQDIIL